MSLYSSLASYNTPETTAEVSPVSAEDRLTLRILTGIYALGSPESHHAQALLDDLRYRQRIFTELTDGHPNVVEL